VATDFLCSFRLYLYSGVIAEATLNP
jgi:hypothetical protein